MIQMEDVIVAIMVDERPSLHGEALLWDKLKEYLSGQSIVYNNREINGRELDVCVLLENYGILVIETKGWRSDSIAVHGVDQIIIEGYASPQRSPKKQARAYRFALLNKIKEKYNLSPLVFDMVCYPFISKAEYLEKRLDIISEEQLTIFKDDLDQAPKFLAKIQAAYQAVKNCPHTPLTQDLILKLRQDWEPHYTPALNVEKAPAAKPYSVLSIFPRPLDSAAAQKIVNSYFQGTKQTVFVSDTESFTTLIHTFDRSFLEHNMQPLGNQLAVGYDKPLSCDSSSFSAFCIEIELCPKLRSICTEETIIVEGALQENQVSLLKQLSEITPFNFEQYQVEHASPERNVLVEAGAGTGKTYSMVSRVAFLCNKGEHAISNVAEEIGMVTFTNDAAHNMKVRLKQMFTNYYVLTGNPRFLKFVEDTDRAHISTIHSFALDLLRKESLYTGLGIDFRITSNAYLRNQIYDIRISEFLEKKEADDPNFANSIPVPVYDLKRKAIALADRLLAKSIDLDKISRSDLGVSIENNIPCFSEIIEHVIIPSEHEYFERLHQINHLDLKESLIRLNQVLHQRTSKFHDLRLQYLFIDEFQDTDDVQIEAFQLLQKAIDTHCFFFVVGDLKQSIYRFRGAKLSAFEKLKSGCLYDWEYYHLSLNYRTDARLLDLFDNIFSSMGSKNYLPYSAEDRLKSRVNTGMNDDELLKAIPCHAKDEGVFLNTFVNVLSAEREKLAELMQQKALKDIKLSGADRTIAILVRSNWQVDKLVDAAKKKGFHIDTKTGGDLFQLPSTIDLYKLVCALVNSSNPLNLVSFIESNYTDLKLDYHLYHGLEFADVLCDLRRILDLFFMNKMEMTWQQIIAMAYAEPALVVLKHLYDALEPWKNLGDSNHSQRHYMANYDYLLERIIKYARADSLTLSQIAEYLRINIVTGKKQLSRNDSLDNGGIKMICTTVHKSKGLEYGTVILPYTDEEIDNIRRIKIDANYMQSGLAYTVQFDNKIRETNSHYRFDDEITEQISEESRILYVALTRAIRSCVWIKNLDRQPNTSWSTLLEG